MSAPAPSGTASLEAELGRAAELLAAADNVALACHVIPDGDALGSSLAVHHLCLQAGKQSVVSWPDPFVVGGQYRSTPGLGLAVPAARFPIQPSLMMTFDCGSMARLNELSAPARWAAENGELVVVDHHATNDRYGSVNLIDASAAATAVVVRQLAAKLGWPLNRDAAWCLYAALVTDTGRFQHSTTLPAVFALAEELASFGLPVARISRELFEEHRFAYLQLAARAIARAQLDLRLGFVETWVEQADLDHFGVRYEEIEGLIDWVRTTSEAEIACVCKQVGDEVRVSLRAVSSVDVGAIAARLGGGGHRLAAGFTARGPLVEVRAAVRREVDLVRQAAADGVDGPA